MKKALVVLLALTFVGALAFADVTPLKITGSIETGAAFVSVKGAEMTWGAYDNDSGHAARTTLGIAFTTPDGNWGIISRLDAEGIVGTPGAQGNSGNYLVGLDRAVLWGNVLPGMLTLKAGVLDEETFATENEGWGNYLDGAVGLEALVTPSPGLTVGYMVPMANSAGATDLNAAAVIVGNGQNTLAGNGSAVDAFSTSAVLLAYNIPDLANVVAGFRFGTGTAASVPTQTGYLWGGVSVKAIPNLLARLEVLYANLGNSTSGDITILEEVGYTMGPLVLDLAMFQDIFSASGSSVAYNFRPNVTYDLGMAKVGVGIDYGTENSYNWGVVGLAKASSPSTGTTASNLDIWPFVTIPFGANQINVGAVYAINDLSNSSANGASGFAVFIDYRVFFK